MKKISCMVIFNLILFISVSIYAEKIAVINVGKIFQEIVAKKAVAEKLEKEFKISADELQDMEKDLQIQVKKLQKNAANPNKKDLQSFETKRTFFLKKAQQFEQNNQRRQQEERNKILKTIKVAAKAVAEKESYDVIVDVSTIIYPENSTNLENITDLVIKKVNE